MAIWEKTLLFAVYQTPLLKPRIQSGDMALTSPNPGRDTGASRSVSPVLPWLGHPLRHGDLYAHVFLRVLWGNPQRIVHDRGSSKRAAGQVWGKGLPGLGPW